MIPSSSLQLAAQISDYLTLGMHHSTVEARQKIAEMVDQYVEALHYAQLERDLRGFGAADL